MGMLSAVGIAVCILLYFKERHLCYYHNFDTRHLEVDVHGGDIQTVPDAMSDVDRRLTLGYYVTKSVNVHPAS